MNKVTFDFFPGNKVVAGYSADCDGAWSYNKPDDYANYELLAKEFGITVDRLVRVHENHTNNILAVDSSNGGEGVIKDGTSGFYDGMITNAKNLMICVISADCVPVFLYDSDNNAIGIVHSGKEGTVKEVAAKAVSGMKDRFNTDPANLKCILGPFICQKHYQLQNKDITGFLKNYSDGQCDKFIKSDKDGYYVDLGTAICFSLEKAGLKPVNIFNCNVCTYENRNLFSFRRDRNYIRHIISFIMLK